MWNDLCSGASPTLVRAIDSSRTLLYDDHRTNTVIDAMRVSIASGSQAAMSSYCVTVLFDLERKQHLRLLRICCRCVNRNDIHWTCEYGLLMWQLLSRI